MTDTSTISVTPLSDALGAEIGGADLSHALDAAAVATVKAALAEHIVLLFRNQDFGPEDQLRFSGYLGPVASRKMPDGYVIPKSSYDNPGIHFISNLRDDQGTPIGVIPDGEMWFHHDTTYKEAPDRATMLYCIETPAGGGGQTRWSNMYKAYDSLPDETKRALAGRMALNVYDYALTEQVDAARDLGEVEHAVHPAVIAHPATGRAALFVSPLMTVRIEDMDPAESDAVLAECFEAGERPAFIYQHKWAPGDFVVWDNLACTHGRSDFPETERRLLRRCKVAGQPTEKIKLFIHGGEP